MSTTGLKPKAKPRKFTTTAKVMVTALSVSALVGSWDLISHSEALKNQTFQATAATAEAQQNLASGANAPAPTPWPTIPALVIPAVPPLPATNLDLAQVLPTNHAQVDNNNSAALPPLATLVPLPTLAPLPDLPAPAAPAVSPALPSTSSGSSGLSSGRHHRSGGS